MTIRLHFEAMPTETARAFQAGAPDANGQPPERHISDGKGVPCRHCLAPVAADEPYLILGYRPFPARQPYAEVGPIFLHAESCARYERTAELPAMYLERESLLIRGYGADDRIVYGTGDVVPTAVLADAAAKILARSDVRYLHVRSASNNCYQCRIEPA
ncbi:MAG: DUF1203 domain-containing protein [Kiloniellales bacterium]|nr:DUF1203 domain-containing protein [Kiloniellales bacterium]